MNNTIKHHRTKVNLSEIEEMKISPDSATNLRRSGFVVISHLKWEFDENSLRKEDEDLTNLKRKFEQVDFKQKFENDLKAFRFKFPGTRKKNFIEDEEIRIKKIKEYLQYCLPDNYSDFPVYQTLNSYLSFVQSQISENIRELHSDDINKINLCYKESADYEVFNASVTDFINMVRNADFEGLDIMKIAKMKYLIYMLSYLLGKDWYIKAAKSIGYKPSDCSGANIGKDDKWRKRVEKICIPDKKKQ